MNYHNLFIVTFFGVIFPTCCCGQQKPDTDYTLFNAVPKQSMREMETDRPDVTESPYTVDAGHFQYETDLIRRVKEKSDVKDTRTIVINKANLKIGIARNTAIQINFETYGIQRETDLISGEASMTEGIGDMSIRIKQNIIGNNSGNFAMALLPYIKFPTSKYKEESSLEGGIIVPMLYKLPNEWKLGFQVEVDRLKDQDQRVMHTEFLQTLTLSHTIVKGLEGIAETYYTYDFKAHHFSNYINAAIQMEIAKDLKVDAGINYGLQHTAQKHYFIGAAYRL